MLLIAPDSFKGTYSAHEVAAAIARGAGADVDLCPVADGGEGTMDIVLRARGGWTDDVAVHDPLGRSVTAALGWIDGGTTALVETALASGLGLLSREERDAEAASSFGTGEMIAAAAAAGAQRIIVTAGGSATTDGGAGAIEAIERCGGLDSVEIIVLCDVATPFERAAEVYGPQKGADAEAIARLTERLHAKAAALPKDPRGRPMTGAAGGLSGALWATYGAGLIPGAAWVLDAVEFNVRIRGADVVVTGEGCLDRQTFEGKLVGHVTARCHDAGKPVYAVVGSDRLPKSEASALGLTSVIVASDRPAMEAAGRSVAAACALGASPPRGVHRAEHVESL